MSDSNKNYRSSYGFHVLAKPIGPICNLACEYCFYLEKEKLYDQHEAWRMDDATLENFTRQYISGQPKGIQEINFAWQGGEPTLMGLDFFRRAVELQKQIAAECGLEKVNISNALQTNATLLDAEWAEFLKKEDFLVGVSIDGPRELHDRFRKDRKGRGSFDMVMAGLENLKAAGVRYNSLTVVQADNAEHPKEVYDFLCNSGFEYQQYIPIVEPHDDGQVTGRSVKPEQFGKFLCGIFDRWLERKDIGKIFVQLFDMMLGVAVGYRPSLCVHAPVCGRSVALEHNGDLYSCDHWVYPENLLGNIANKNLAEMVDSDFQQKFGRDKFDKLTDYCRKCDFVSFCHGACPKDRFAKAPGGQEGHQYLCRGYKMFYAHSIEIFSRMAMCLQQRRPACDYETIPPLNSKADSGKKTGRNQTCPCGSGKKYKNCCGKNK